MGQTPIYFIDISKIGKDFTGTKDIITMTNELAVLESVKNIVSTEPRERVMRPTFGCALSRFLFEPIDAITSSIIKKTIYEAIYQHESRVENVVVDIIENPDQNSYVINITFNMKTSNTTQTLSLDVNKIR